MAEPVALIIFEGGGGTSRPERRLGDVRRAIALDVVERIVSWNMVTPLIVCTDDRWLAETLRGAGWGVTVELDQHVGDSQFHWGRRLWRIVQDYHLERIIVMGGASAPLLARSDLEAMVACLRCGEPSVWANNVYSADIIALTPADRLGRIDLPASDNALPYRLLEQAGLSLAELPHSLGLTFDVDTPTDAAILALHPKAGKRVRRLLHDHTLTERLLAARRVLLDRWEEAWIAGRMSGRLLRFLDEKTRCRLRVFSELRGMKSLGLEEEGAVVSLLASWVEAIGPEAFFERLSECCGAAFIDTRPLFAHRGRRVDAPDRFASDELDVGVIRDPWVRQFTAAAKAAPIPVILGGHSLVSGGLWALLDGD